MNFEMATTSVQQHMHEVRDQAARSRGRSAGPAAATARRTNRTLHAHRSPHTQAQTRRQARAQAGRHPSGLRGRLGVTLIEAGLHLLATDGPQGSA